MANYASGFCFATCIPKAFVTMVASLSIFCIPPPRPALYPMVHHMRHMKTASQVLWEAVKNQRESYNARLP